MPQEKPAFFVEFFRNPLTEAYPEVFQPLGDGIELTRWWLGHDDPRRCSLFSLFAIRHENRWGLDAEGILAVSSERPRRRTVDGRRGGDLARNAGTALLGRFPWRTRRLVCLLRHRRAFSIGSIQASENLL